MTKTEVDGLKKRLNWFIVLAVTILLAIAQQSWSNAGFKKLITYKLDTFMEQQSEENRCIKKMLEEDRTTLRDVASQGMEDGWYKPKVIIRNVD